MKENLRKDVHLNLGQTFRKMTRVVFKDTIKGERILNLKNKMGVVEIKSMINEIKRRVIIPLVKGI